MSFNQTPTKWHGKENAADTRQDCTDLLDSATAETAVQKNKYMAATLPSTKMQIPC